LKKQDNNNFSKKEALSALSRICSKKEVCSSEAIEKLDNWGISDSDKKEIIDYLIKEKYIDDVRYATHYASDKFRFNKWGKYKIASALKIKKLPEDIIGQALDLISTNDYRILLREELEKKMHSIPKSSSYELKGKLYRFAASRGFENDLILELLNELTQIKR
jgi:regulatory protein